MTRIIHSGNQDLRHASQVSNDALRAERRAGETPMTKTIETAEVTLRTKHVAAKFNMTPVQLRRVLRSMPKYADGVHTNYRWDPKDTKAMDEIGVAIKALAAKKAAAAQAAKEALAKAEATKKAQDVLDSKTKVA